MDDEKNVGQEQNQPETPAEPNAPAAPPSPPPPPPPAAEAAPPPPAEGNSKEVEEGKAFAILSYVLSLIGLPFFLIPLIMRNNDFSLYHAKQTMMIWLVGIVGGVVSGILMFICIGAILAVVLAIGLLVLTIMGLINAAQGQQKPLPIIGKWGEDWFKGLVKV
ncbi:MAG: hypothetical protein U9N73_08345 [Candidatus Auribacterota bacterium]|nr:hypothetical protein [Candidatus Auribacterota bacterium]